MQEPAPLPKKAAWKTARTLAIILILLFIPAIRSCGQVSSGLPFVALSQGDSGSIRVHWANFALNLAITSFLVLAAAIGFRRLKSPITKKTLRAGFDSIGIYALLVMIGYLVVYPLTANADEHGFAGWFFIVYASFVHPYIWIVSDLSDLFSGSLSRSTLFGDSYDLPMRLGFILMCALWFGLGCAASAVSRRMKGKRIVSAGY